MGTHITWMLYECSILVGLFCTNYRHFSNVKVLTFMECSYLMSYESSILVWMSCTKNEHSSNLQGWTFLKFDIIYTLNWDISYFMKTELLPSASTAQTTSNVLATFRIQMVHLAFSIDHSMNIITWTVIQFSVWTMKGLFLNVRPIQTLLECSMDATPPTGLRHIHNNCTL